MKLALSILTLVSGFFAAGLAAHAQEGNPLVPIHEWFCTATGLDRNDHSQHSVSGDLKPTRDEAETSAIVRCNQIYMLCSVSTCIQER
jgi:hypothetical protein